MFNSNMTSTTYSDKTCIIIGNGPSLKNFDFNKLNNVSTIGLNAAYRYWKRINWYPTYYCCFDLELMKTHHQNIRKLLLENKVKKIFVRSTFFDYEPDLKGHKDIYILESLNRSKYFKSIRPGLITTGGYVPRVAMYLGFKKILLLGIDCKYVEIIPEAKKIDNIKLEIVETPKSNPNYFFDDYQRKGDKYHIPNPNGNIHLQVFNILKQDMQRFKFNIQVINCNKQSMLYEKNIFPYNDLDKELAKN